MFRIKTNKWQEFCDNAEQFGFKKDNYGNLIKSIPNGQIVIYSYMNNRILKKEVYDSTTKCGFKYQGEFNQVIKPYIKDLVEMDYVENTRCE